jgi:signal transduction histidine kinase
MHETCRLVVDVEADPNVEPSSEDLRILLFEATRELLFNVVKHAQTGSARVTLSAAPNGELEIVVSDDGAGFNPNEPKGERAMARGFGLFSIRERLELLGGRMGVDTAVGRGSRIAILAPRRGDKETPTSTP